MSLSQYLTETAANLTKAAEADLDGAMERAIDVIVTALTAGKPLLVCGNGGSMADAQHIAGELVARFLLNRKGLPVIALGANPSTVSAWSNDVSYEDQFARETEAFGSEGGVLLGISTSGNSGNVLVAMDKAKAMGMTVIALTGQGGGKMADKADILLAPPVTGTPRIQETHSPLYHYLCMRVEAACAGTEA